MAGEAVGTGAVSVQAEIGYLNPGTGVQEGFATTDARRKTFVREQKRIQDARLLSEPPSLDRNGVVLAPFRSELQNYRDAEEVTRVFFPEVSNLVKELTGATYAYAASFVVRSEDPAKEAEVQSTKAFNHAYARFAHIDVSEKGSTPEMCRDVLRAELGLSAEESSADAIDVAILNLWKPVDRPAFHDPMTVLDFESLSTAEEVREMPAPSVPRWWIFYPHAFVPSHCPSLLPPPGMPNESAISMLLPSARHRWLYWSEQKVDEALVFKQLDTRPNVARHGFHTSFDNPVAGKDAPKRRSIEVRVVVGFPKRRSETKEGRDSSLTRNEDAPMPAKAAL